jgi:outer membrane protein assembly factor BamB
LLLAPVLVGGCGIFGDKVDESLKPAELVDFDPEIRVRRVWSAKLGDDAEFLRLGLRPAGDGRRIYAASADGKVSAFDPDNGRREWQVKLDVGVTAGPGVGRDTVVVVGTDGEVIALNAEDGSERWRNNDGAESVAQPVIGDDKVFVQSADNRLRALELFDGELDWEILQTMPVLTMRGSSSPLIVGNDVVAGFDNGRVLSADIASGDINWETLLSPQSGRSDLERLADVDGSMVAVGQDIYAAGYQGRLASLAAESGQTLWAQEISSYEGVSADWNSVYTVTDNGVLIALSRRNGAETWRQDALLRREPTLPVPFRTTVVTADFEGYVHFFSNASGQPVARVRFGKDAITSPPVVYGTLLYVQSDSGSLAAYEIVEPERAPNRAPDIADDEARGT